MVGCAHRSQSEQYSCWCFLTRYCTPWIPGFYGGVVGVLSTGDLIETGRLFQAGVTRAQNLHSAVQTQYYIIEHSGWMCLLPY